MKKIFLLAFLSLSGIAQAASDNYIHLYEQAINQLKAGQPQAIKVAQRCFDMSIAASDDNYANAIAINGAEYLYKFDKIVDAGKFAEQCNRVLDEMPDPRLSATRQQKRRIILLGYQERGLQMDGKLGAAWKVNRQVAEVIRGKKVTAESDGAAITIPEILGLSLSLQESAWRLVEREAEYLDLAGRSTEAIKLLDEAAIVIKESWPKWSSGQRFYPTKVLATRAVILDFLGFRIEAMAAQTELEQMLANQQPSINSYINLKMNLLRNQSQWFGPSVEYLRSARQLVSLAEAVSTQKNMRIMVAKMEMDFRESKEALAALQKAHRDSDPSRSAYEDFYSQRDLIQARQRIGEKNLDHEYQAMLLKVRQQGNKRGEPTVYRSYGQYLLDCDRPGDALPMFQEALRLTQSFGWINHQSTIHISIIQCHYRMSDRAGFLAAIGALEKFLSTHPTLPDERLHEAHSSLALYWSELGEAKNMQQHWNAAIKAGESLPEYQKSWITPALQKKILLAQGSFSDKQQQDAMPLQVQPASIASYGQSNTNIRASFTVVNTTKSIVHGHWIISGATATVTKDGKTWNSHNTELRIPDNIDPDETSILTPEVAQSSDSLAVITIAWESNNQKPGRASQWELKWGDVAESQTVMDASLLTSDPFRSLSLFHEIAIHPTSADAIPCRIVASQSLRIEYYDCRSQKLLAVDANGNGNFTEEGDLHFASKYGFGAAMIPLPVGAKQTTLEVKVYSADGKAPNPSGEKMTLTTEIFRNDNWISEAVNTLR